MSALALYYTKRAQNKQYPKLLNKQVHSIQNDIALLTGSPIPKFWADINIDEKI